MKSYLVGAGRYDGRPLDTLAAQPEFRRATRNMCFAYLAAMAALEFFSPEGTLGLIVATSHGELEVTLSFLDELRRSGVARPLLFQNSLHNAILGFLARQLGVRGPAITVSDEHDSGENAVRTAELLLATEKIDAVLVVGVDTIPRVHESLFHSLYPATPGEGAGAILLAREGQAAFDLSTTNGGPVPAGYYDSDYVEALAVAFKDRATEILRSRPDGSATHTRLQWQT